MIKVVPFAGRKKTEGIAVSDNTATKFIPSILNRPNKESKSNSHYIWI